MVFSSLTFLWSFLPCVLVLCLLARKPALQNVVLLIASLFFYAWGEPVYVFLLLISILLNYLLGLLMEALPSYKRPIFALALVVNLCGLGYFKYSAFIVSALNTLAGRTLFAVPTVSLPIGISFFTFQVLSYIIDLYRGEYPAQKNIAKLALYVSFFPQLIAGPIVKYKDIAAQLQDRRMTLEGMAVGFRRFVYGLAKKVLLANVLAEVVDEICEGQVGDQGAIVVWMMAICYTLQIYYDFSGYSDMAIGLGSIFGFHFQENFNYPYLSGSIREFWQRWHISLGSWFREYLYIPLGGNRKGKARTYCNLVIVFLLTGLWHGASRRFVFWGAYHGFFQILERAGLGKRLSQTRVIKYVYTSLVVVIGWVFFRVESFHTALAYVEQMLLFWRTPLLGFYGIGNRALVSLLCGILGCGFLPLIFSKKWKGRGLPSGNVLELGYCTVLFVLCLMALAVNSYNPFIYFKF